jgi:murein DD-endopeptidase MepM/ murein hydrolase activator NlpD
MLKTSFLGKTEKRIPNASEKEKNMTDFRETDRIRKLFAASRQTLRHVRSLLLNYSKPLIVTACGIAALVAVGAGGYHYVQAHNVEYYSVLLEGKPVGEISSKQKVEQLLADKASQLEKADTPISSVLNENQVSFETERAFKKTTDDETTLAHLSSMLQTHPIGVKLIVNGKEVGIVRDQKTADTLLQQVKDKYVSVSVAKKSGIEVKSLSLKTGSDATSATAATSKRTVTSVNFVEQVATVTSDIDPTQLSDPEELYTKLTEGQPIPRKYTVKKGDCLGCIASKLNVSEELIHKNNDWIVNDNLQIGDVLDLSESEPPLLNVNSVEQLTEVEAIDPPIEYKKSDAMKLGQQKVLKEGTEGQQEVTYRLIKRNGSLLEEEIVTKKLLKAAVPTLILKGTKVIRGVGSGQFSWPVIGARITSYMGMRWGRMHQGIDIVGNSSILAADEGVIEYAGYKSGGLGNAIIINHNNGFKTVYGHMKSVKVKEGQIVEKGDVIGIMGSTGHSTGTHLHFEVHLNGKIKNPTSYL